VIVARRNTLPINTLSKHILDLHTPWLNAAMDAGWR
jgi:hypothetical protein